LERIGQSIGTTLKPRLKTLARLQKDVDFELVVMTNTRPRLNVPDLRWSFVPWRAEDEPHLVGNSTSALCRWKTTHFSAVNVV